MGFTELISPKSEGPVEEGPIRCIFFCEFHDTAGPIISCAVSSPKYIPIFKI